MSSVPAFVSNLNHLLHLASGVKSVMSTKVQPELPPYLTSHVQKSDSKPEHSETVTKPAYMATEKTAADSAKGLDPPTTNPVSLIITNTRYV